jgi:hypothetical protein
MNLYLKRVDIDLIIEMIDLTTSENKNSLYEQTPKDNFEDYQIDQLLDLKEYLKSK